MLKWEKPVLSVLGISQTNDSVFEELSGVSAFTGEFVEPDEYEVSTEAIDLDWGWRKCKRCHCRPCCCNGSHHGC